MKYFSKESCAVIDNELSIHYKLPINNFSSKEIISVKRDKFKTNQISTFESYGTVFINHGGELESIINPIKSKINANENVANQLYNILDTTAPTPPFTIYILNKENLILHSLQKGYIFRQLDKNDSELYEKFKNECPKGDFDKALVSLEDPVAFGIIFDGKIVAIATLWFWANKLVDIGVLVHPDYKHKGLGKTVVSHLCKWVIDNDKICVYRAEQENVGSVNLALSVGFKPYCELYWLNMK